MPRSSNSGPATAFLLCGALLLLFGPNVCRGATLTVVVEGVSGALRDNVLASLGIHRERERKDLFPARIRRLHERAPEEIRMALQPFGYYRPRIEATLDQNGEEWIARYRIDPGTPIPVAVVEVNIAGEGADDPAFRAPVENFPIKPGDTLSHAVYENAKQQFQDLAAERGYFDLRFTRQEVRVDLESYRAEIYLDVDTGPRYRFGAITSDQDILSSELLARYVRLHPGQPYSTAALLDAQLALLGSNYFSDVQIEADPQDADDRTIPVRIHVTPRPPNKYTFGIGYGTDTGARGQIGWERFYLNPQGHHTRVELRGSEIERSVTAGYFIPIRNPRTDQLAFTGGYNEIDTRVYDTRIRRLAVSRTTTRGHLLETLSLTQQREDFEISDQRRTTSLLLPGISWTYYLGEERVYTRLGARAALDLRGASENLASDVSLAQARFQIKGIFPVSNFGRVITRGEIGATRIGDFDQLPASLRFFAGGDQSVRGYAYNTLGPRDALGNVIGGRHLLVGSVEYEQHLTGNWSAAVFYDAGNALDNFTDPLERGAGIGVRWRSPIGQIRLDAASAVSAPERPWRIHLTIGPDL